MGADVGRTKLVIRVFERLSVSTPRGIRQQVSDQSRPGTLCVCGGIGLLIKGQILPNTYTKIATLCLARFPLDVVSTYLDQQHLDAPGLGIS